jgi:hypothetical protein
MNTNEAAETEIFSREMLVGSGGMSHRRFWSEQQQALHECGLLLIALGLVTVLPRYEKVEQLSVFHTKHFLLFDIETALRRPDLYIDFSKIKTVQFHCHYMWI